MVDTLSFSRAVEALYASVLDPSLWPKALEAATGFVGGISAMLFYQDHRAAAGQAIHTWNVDPDWTKLYFDKYIVMNPVLPYTAFIDVGVTTALSRVLDFEEFRRTVFFSEWAAPQEFGDVIVSILDKSATTMGLIGISQSSHDGIVRQDRIERMEMLAPHARRAVQLSHAFAGIAVRAEAFANGFDMLPNAAVLLDAQGHVLFANRAAMAIDEPCFRIVGQHLALSDREAANRLREASRAAQSKDTAKAAATIQIGDDTTSPRRILQFVPLPKVSTAHRAAPHAVGLLLVRPLLSKTAPPLDVLAESYRLTPRELQVFTGILQFGSVPEVARIYGLAPTTVRTHLQSIFDKTGVRRQADLMKLGAALGGPPPPA